MATMHRFFLGLSAITLIVVACGSDDDKKVSRGGDAGAGGEAGDASVGVGGSSLNAAGEGGETSTPVAGSGGDAGTGGGGGDAGSGGGTAGETAGGAPVVGGSGGAAGQANAAGAGGDGPPPVSAFCEPGQYYAGEGGCVTCEEAPQLIEIPCTSFSDSTRLVSDGGPLWIDLYPPAFLREPVAHELTVSFKVGDAVTEATHPGDYSYDNGYWNIDIADDASTATDEVRVLPFTVRTACGDTFKLTDEVIFVQAEPSSDTYDLICPNQG